MDGFFNYKKNYTHVVNTMNEKLKTFENRYECESDSEIKWNEWTIFY